MENAYAPISEACVKALSDKTYDKRKIAATEIEKLVTRVNFTILIESILFSDRPVLGWLRISTLKRTTVKFVG